MKENLLEYLKRFLFQNSWMDEHISEQARSIFTTICLIENIDADTSSCDNMLSEIYLDAMLKTVIQYEDFMSFMLELIV